MSRLSTWLWFDGNAEDAAHFYARLFGGDVTAIQRFPEGNGVFPAGSVMTATFRIFDQEINGLNGGPDFKHSPATSFMVKCPDQDEIDRLWSALSEGGQEMPCGWVTDRFGISWQIVPEQLDELLAEGGDVEARQRVWNSLMSMVKIDLKTLQDAHASR